MLILNKYSTTEREREREREMEREREGWLKSPYSFVGHTLPKLCDIQDSHRRFLSSVPRRDIGTGLLLFAVRERDSPWSSPFFILFGVY